MSMENKELSTKTHSSVSRFTPEQLANSDLNSATVIHNLVEAPAATMPMSIQYWSPEVEGDEKSVYVAGIGFSEIADMETGELKNLECVFLVEPIGKVLVRWQNASKVLVANIKAAIERKEIIPGTTLTPVRIKYLGLQKNSRNAFKSKRFEILGLVVSTIKKGE
jgi:hypothetical protein